MNWHESINLELQASLNFQHIQTAGLMERCCWCCAVKMSSTNQVMLVLIYSSCYLLKWLNVMALALSIGQVWPDQTWSVCIVLPKRDTLQVLQPKNLSKKTNSKFKLSLCFEIGALDISYHLKFLTCNNIFLSFHQVLFSSQERMCQRMRELSNHRAAPPLCTHA